ncbi:MAG: cupredoxin family copper-binding protein [Candidatus Paceibacterota bacterium]|jgi:plastocyanin
MNKTIIIIAVVVVVGIGAYYFAVNNGSNGIPAYTPPVSNNNQIPTPTPPAPTSVTTPTPTPTTPTPTPVTKNVTIQGFAFNQSSLTIKKGDTVVWTNKDSAPHTVTGNAGGPKSGTLNQNQTYSFTFNSVGTFSYRCALHPSMTGSVTVTE